MGPVAFAWTFSLLGAGGVTDIATGIDGRSTGGLMAVVPGEESTPAIDFTMTLMAGLRRSSRQSTFLLVYRPRYYYQIPNVADNNFPLFMHQLETSYLGNLSPRTSVSWSANGEAGAVSYSSLLQLFPTGTAAVGGRFIPLGNVNTSGAITHQTSPLNSVTAEAVAGYRTVLGSDNSAGIPTSVDLGGQVTNAVQLSPRDQLALSVGTTYVVRDLAGDSPTPETTTLANENLSGVLSATWRRSLRRVSNLEVQGGVGASGLDGNTPFSVFPIFTISNVSNFRGLGSNWIWNSSLGARGFFDPLLATFRPQGFMTLSLAGQHSRALSSGVTFNFFTPLTTEAILPYQYETNSGLAIRLSYLLAPGVTANMGANWQFRGGHWSEFSALRLQNELTGMFGIRYTLGTENTHGSWL